MRMVGQESSGVGGKIAIAIGVLLLLLACGLAIYGGTISPQRHMVEKVLPDDRFAK
jgi:hypothetical protein